MNPNPNLRAVVAAVVALLMGFVVGGWIHNGATRKDVIDAQVWFEHCGEAAGLKEDALWACIDAEKPVPTTEDPAAPSTTVTPAAPVATLPLTPAPAPPAPTTATTTARPVVPTTSEACDPTEYRCPPR